MTQLTQEHFSTCFDHNQLFAPGATIVRRERLKGHLWVAYPMRVVEHTPQHLVAYLPAGTHITYPQWPFDSWQHPWQTMGITRWSGHGKLSIMRPGDWYSVDVFWQGPKRQFSAWYFNIQSPLKHLVCGVETLDLELDYVLHANGCFIEKDSELLNHRIALGQFEEQQGAKARVVGQELTHMVRSEQTWWDPTWSAWKPPADWGPAQLPDNWLTNEELVLK